VNERAMMTYRRLQLSFSVVADFDNPHCEFDDFTRIVVKSAHDSALRWLISDTPGNTTPRKRGECQVVSYRSTGDVWRKEFMVESLVPIGKDVDELIEQIHEELDEHDWGVACFERDYPAVLPTPRDMGCPPLTAVPDQTAGGRDQLRAFSVTMVRPADKGSVSGDNIPVTARLSRDADGRGCMWETAGNWRMPLGPRESYVWPRTDPAAELVLELSQPLVSGTFLINGSVLRIVQKP